MTYTEALAQYDSLCEKLKWHKTEIESIEVELHTAKKQVQESCDHSSIREEDGYDHHKNEEWTKTYCNICGKYLGRY